MDERTGQRFQTRPGNGNQSEGAAKNQISAPSISLPKGGDAIRGMGEKFAANPVAGIGSVTAHNRDTSLICRGTNNIPRAARAGESMARHKTSPKDNRFNPRLVLTVRLRITDTRHVSAKSTGADAGARGVFRVGVGPLKSVPGFVWDEQV